MANLNLPQDHPYVLQYLQQRFPGVKLWANYCAEDGTYRLYHGRYDNALGRITRDAKFTADYFTFDPQKEGWVEEVVAKLALVT